MRLNQFLAKHTDLSRRGADAAITEGRVEINGVLARIGDTMIDSDAVTLDSQPVKPLDTMTVVFNKPVGYVCSRNGQGSKTIYDILPENLHHLNPVGRLDKDSSGLLLLTNDGELANQLAHPSNNKDKKYQVELNKPISSKLAAIMEEGVDIGDDRLSFMKIKKLDDKTCEVTISEGRNRQVRRTFEAVGYKVTRLHRTHFGQYQLKNMKPGEWIGVRP